MDIHGKQKLSKKTSQSNNKHTAPKNSQPISKNIIENEHLFKNIFNNCSDIMFREVKIHSQVILLFIYVDGMVDTEIITTNVLEPLLYDGLPQGLGGIESLEQVLEQERFSVLQTKKLSDVEEITEYILKGNLAIFVDGEGNALLADVKKFETRSIEEPSTEASLRGSKRVSQRT